MKSCPMKSCPMKSCPMKSCPMKSWRGHHAVDVEAGKLHFVVGDRLVGECPYLGNAQSRGSRHYGSEVHLRIAEREIAVAVGGIGTHQRKIARNGGLEHIIAVAEAANLGILGQLGAKTDRGVERRNTGAARADALS